MKKIIWIYSINVRGMAPFGYSTTLTLKQAKKFQGKLKLNLPSETDVQFISYDISNNEMLNADLIVFSDMDSKYLSNELKEKGIVISTKDMVSNNIEKIEEIMTSALKNS